MPESAKCLRARNAEERQMPESAKCTLSERCSGPATFHTTPRPITLRLPRPPGLSMLRRLAGILAVAVSAGAQSPIRAVLVTGAPSGIGRKITERLAANGDFVYAGGRTPAEIDALNGIPNVKAVRLDVTSASDIANALATITQAGRGLYGIVNNAGVLVVAPFIEADDKDLDYIFGVNLYGPIRITKAFAPLLIQSKGRVINISSLNGIVAQPIIGAYSI